MPQVVTSIVKVPRPDTPPAAEVYIFQPGIWWVRWRTRFGDTGHDAAEVCGCFSSSCRGADADAFRLTLYDADAACVRILPEGFAVGLIGYEVQLYAGFSDVVPPDIAGLSEYAVKLARAYERRVHNHV